MMAFLFDVSKNSSQDALNQRPVIMILLLYQMMVRVNTQRTAPIAMVHAWTTLMVMGYVTNSRLWAARIHLHVISQRMRLKKGTATTPAVLVQVAAILERLGITKLKNAFPSTHALKT